MGVPPEVSSTVMGRLFSIFIYVNILISLPARTHGSKPLQLTSGSAGSVPCFALGLSLAGRLQVLRSPMERVLALITLHGADEFAVAGEVTGTSGLHAPFFEFIVLEGRPLQFVSQGEI